MTAQRRPMLRTGMEPLDTCPPGWRALHVGDCAECRRPMAPRRRMAVEPELSRWYVRAFNTGTGICGSCHWRLYTYKNGRQKRKRPPRLFTEALTGNRIRELRAMVGACVECGWTQGFGKHIARGCPTLVEDGMRDTA